MWHPIESVLGRNFTVSIPTHNLHVHCSCAGARAGLGASTSGAGLGVSAPGAGLGAAPAPGEGRRGLGAAAGIGFAAGSGAGAAGGGGLGFRAAGDAAPAVDGGGDEDEVVLPTEFGRMCAPLPVSFVAAFSRTPLVPLYNAPAVTAQAGLVQRRGFQAGNRQAISRAQRQKNTSSAQRIGFQGLC